MAQWIRPLALNKKVPSSNLLSGTTVVPLGKALYPPCLVPSSVPKWPIAILFS